MWALCASTPSGTCLNRSQSIKEVGQDVIAHFVDVFAVDVADHIQVRRVEHDLAAA